MAVAGKVGSRGVFLTFSKNWLEGKWKFGAQTGQTLVVEEAGSRRCTTFDSTRCCADIDIDVDLCSKNTLDTHKRWLPEKIIKNKPTFGV